MDVASKPEPVAAASCPLRGCDGEAVGPAASADRPVADRQTESLRAYVKLLRASKAVLNRVEVRLATRGLTPTQLGVLEVVYHKGPLTQRDLSRKVLTSAGNMTDVIDKLEARSLVRRMRCPEDRRSVRVELTTCGHDLIRALFPPHAQDIAAAMAGLDAEELHRLGDLLRKLGHAAADGAVALANGPDAP